MIALDTNLLVYAHRSRTPEHERAIRAMTRAAISERGWGIALPCLAEFWAVVTHPDSVGRPSRAEEVQSFIAQLTAAGMAIWLPQSGFDTRLMESARKMKIAGARIFDLQIGLIAVEEGAHELWTHDAGFQAPPGLKCRDPL